MSEFEKMVHGMLRSPLLPKLTNILVVELSVSTPLPTKTITGRPSDYFQTGFSTKILYAFLAFPTQAKCPAFPNILDLIIQQY